MSAPLLPLFLRLEGRPVLLVGGVMRSPRAAAMKRRSRASRGGRVSGACTANTRSSSSAETPAFCAARCCSDPDPCDHHKLPIDTAGTQDSESYIFF